PAYIAHLTGSTSRATRRACTWRRWVAGGVGRSVLAVSVWLTEALRFTLLEDDGKNTLGVQQELPVGTSLSITDESVERAEEVLASMSEVDSYEAVIGGDGAREEPHKASYWITVSAEADMDTVREGLLEDL